MGYKWMRSWASLGSYDFIAFKKSWTCGQKHTDMLMIQVKGDPWDKPDIEALKKDCEQAGATPIYIYREVRKKKLGITRKGTQRTQPMWVTVYL